MNHSGNSQQGSSGNPNGRSSGGTGGGPLSPQDNGPSNGSHGHGGNWNMHPHKQCIPITTWYDVSISNVI